MDLGIAGKVALVTGGSRGIGLQVSRELAANGAKVFIVARGQEGIDAAVESIHAAGGEAGGYAGDLLHVENYDHAAEASTELFGAPDIAVFNFASPPAGGFEELGDDDFTAAFHQVVICYAHLVRAVIEPMKAKRWGRIVTIGSGVVKQPIRKATAGFDYVLANTTRVAAVGLVKTLAADYAPYGITLNTIGTGTFATESFYDFFRCRAAAAGVTLDEAVEMFTSTIPMKRAGKVEEIAQLCVFLCSEGSGFTTGETILCEGGQVESML